MAEALRPQRVFLQASPVGPLQCHLPQGIILVPHHCSEPLLRSMAQSRLGSPRSTHFYISKFMGTPSCESHFFLLPMLPGAARPAPTLPMPWGEVGFGTIILGLEILIGGLSVTLSDSSHSRSCFSLVVTPAGASQQPPPLRLILTEPG